MRAEGPVLSQALCRIRSRRHLVLVHRRVQGRPPRRARGGLHCHRVRNRAGSASAQRRTPMVVVRVHRLIWTPSSGGWDGRSAALRAV